MSELGIRVDDSTVRFERTLPGPIEKAWAYLADSDKRAQWFTSGVLSAKVGEPFEMTFHHADYSPHKSPPPPGYENVDREPQKMTSILLALEPPHRLAFTFGKPIADDQYTEVDIRLTPQPDGKVKLTLTHSKLPDRTYALNISGGWHSHLAMLQHKAEGRVPPSIWDVWRQLQGVYDKRYG
ncbi:MAG: SRPBCC family protein [Pseudomonadota bacterium]